MCWRRHSENSADTVIVGRLNGQSLKPKIPDLLTGICDVYGFDVVAVSEISLSLNVPSGCCR